MANKYLLTYLLRKAKLSDLASEVYVIAESMIVAHLQESSQHHIDFQPIDIFVDLSIQLEASFFVCSYIIKQFMLSVGQE